MSDDLKSAVRRKGSFWKTIRAVAWSFIGVRNAKQHESDLSELNPLHVVIAGIVGAALFVVVLVVLVKWVIGSGLAGG